MSSYQHNDKKSGDGLAITDWNNLSSAVAGSAGLTLALPGDKKVGIGTLSPSEKFHVAGDAKFGEGSSGGKLEVHKDASSKIGPIITLQNGGGGGGAGGAIDFNGYNVGSGPPTCRVQSLDDGSFSSHLTVSTKLPGSNDNALVEHLRITSRGRVGIGQNAPGEKLHVAGNVRADRFIGDGSQLTNLTVGLTGLNLATTSGNVGIGTTTPRSDSKLDVNGAINSRGLRFDWEAPGHINIDGALYRTGGQVHLTVDDNFYIRDNQAGSKFHFITDSGRLGIGGNHPHAPLSIAGAGKEGGPDGIMHLTNGCILFGGNNNGREVNSAQISAGKHVANSLNIVGMAANADAGTRKVDIWAEGGLVLHGAGGNWLRITLEPNGLVFAIGRSRHGGTSQRRIIWDGDHNWDQY